MHRRNETALEIDTLPLSPHPVLLAVSEMVAGSDKLGAYRPDPELHDSAGLLVRKSASHNEIAAAIDDLTRLGPILVYLNGLIALNFAPSQNARRARP